MAAGLNAEGGSPWARHATRTSESPLHGALSLVRSPGAGRWSYFLRAETMHGLYSYLEGVGDRSGYHEMSHGESILEVLQRHFDTPGLYVLDEPESALSFSSCLALVGVLDDLARRGGQVLCATHSPLLTAPPGRDDPAARRRRLCASCVGRPRARQPLAPLPRRSGGVPAPCGGSRRRADAAHLTAPGALTAVCVRGFTGRRRGARLRDVLPPRSTGRGTDPAGAMGRRACIVDCSSGCSAAC
jgi:hypothetical protein